MHLKAFFRLTRIEHSLFLALAVLVGEVVVTRDIQLWPTVFGVLSVFFMGLGSFALNDFMDYPTDKKNKRKDRPIVSGTISAWAAMITAKVSFPLGVLFALLVNLNCFWIAVVFSILAILYSYTLKKLLLLGNMFIAFSMAIPFVFGSYIVSDQISASIQVLASIAFLTGLGREIIKSIQDMAGDKKYGRWTLPIALGKTIPKYFAVFYILIAIAMSPIPFLLLPKFQNNWLYMGPVLLTDVILLWNVWSMVRLKELERVRKLTLLALGIGLVGFLLGAL
jgi:geranylgeranylglycerol-phosphate geranylgeranyltransferase